MSDVEDRKDDDVVPLSQAGMPEPDIDRQLEKLCHSDALEGKRAKKDLLRHLVRESVAGNAQRLRVPAITKALFGEYVTGDSRVRVDTGKLREHLDAYYGSSEAKAGEIRFTIPTRQYVVHAPRASGKSNEFQARQPEERRAARILEPADNAEVHQRVPVRGRIDALDVDLRPWLVVRTPVGDLYPQCRVRRYSPEWQEEVRIGLVQWGADEGAVYEIMLVAANADGDVAFYQYLRANRDGFGPLLPTDCIVLDAKRVTRRDIRPQS
jgi:hypothetical protein